MEISLWNDLSKADELQSLAGKCVRRTSGKRIVGRAWKRMITKPVCRPKHYKTNEQDCSIDTYSLKKSATQGRMRFLVVSMSHPGVDNKKQEKNRQYHDTGMF